MPRLTNLPDLARASPWDTADLLVKGKKQRRRVRSTRKSRRDFQPEIQQYRSLVTIQFPPTQACIVCGHPDPPGTLAWHIANYHRDQHDVFDAVRAYTKGPVPRPLARLAGRKLAEAVARYVGGHSI